MCSFVFLFLIFRFSLLFYSMLLDLSLSYNFYIWCTTLKQSQHVQILFSYIFIQQRRLPFLLRSELILRTGPINKRKGFFSKRRLLILTDFPSLIYVDQEKMTQKGEIYWSSRMVVELKNKNHFFVHTVWEWGKGKGRERVIFEDWGGVLEKQDRLREW